MLYRTINREYKIYDGTVILVEDGIATGATMIAAARWVRKHKPKQLIIASPIAPKQIVKSPKSEADQIEVIRNPSNFKALERFHQCFDAILNNRIMQNTKARFVF
jgi:putative phosphoribosyl transferase